MGVNLIWFAEYCATDPIVETPPPQPDNPYLSLQMASD
jgi:hypothetical protein